MKLEGSCHCGSVTFTVDSKTPCPFMHCYCSMCRKTNGGTGATINIGAQAETLDVKGIENVSIYRVRLCSLGFLQPAVPHFSTVVWYRTVYPGTQDASSIHMQSFPTQE